MALVVNGNATVATGMSPIVEGALYADQIFIDGLTFTSKYNIGNAGQIQVVKYSRSAEKVKPKAPGSDFTDEEYKNTVIDININNAFQKSVKVPAYFGATLPSDVMRDKTWEVTEEVREGRQCTGIAILVKEGTEVSDATEITAENVKKVLLTARTTLRKKNARPNVVIVKPEIYAAIQEYAGKEFTPMFNDDIIRTGRVGMWLGFIIIECTLLDGTSTYTYLDAAGSEQSVSVADVEFIMYDFQAFSIIDRLDALRYVQSEHFNGNKVQEELATGFKVTNSDCVYVKKKAA